MLDVLLHLLRYMKLMSLPRNIPLDEGIPANYDRVP